VEKKRSGQVLPGGKMDCAATARSRSIDGVLQALVSSATPSPRRRGEGKIRDQIIRNPASVSITVISKPARRRGFAVVGQQVH
jgi:hypothetical protein